MLPSVSFFFPYLLEQGVNSVRILRNSTQPPAVHRVTTLRSSSIYHGKVVSTTRQHLGQPHQAAERPCRTDDANLSSTGSSNNVEHAVAATDVITMHSGTANYAVLLPAADSSQQQVVDSSSTSKKSRSSRRIRYHRGYKYTKGWGPSKVPCTDAADVGKRGIL